MQYLQIRKTFDHCFYLSGFAITILFDFNDCR